jgi:hypothetical protein
LEHRRASVDCDFRYICPRISKGVRRWLGEADLQVLSNEQRANHDYIFEYRNKHVAHSVNEFEENLARAYYCDERVHEEGISSIGYGGGRVSGLSERDAHAVVELTNIFEKYLEQQITDENKRLLELVRQCLSRTSFRWVRGFSRLETKT